MFGYEHSFLHALLLTIFIEVPIVFAMARYIYKKREYSDIVLVSVVASVITLPYFWFILPVYVSDRNFYIFIGESLVVLIEAFLYWRLLKLKLHQAFLLSLVANCISACLGIL